MTSPTPPPATARTAVPTADDDRAHAEAMARVDGCPECVVNVEAPYVAERVGDEDCCAYACTDCGHWWTTSWKVG